MTTPPPTYTYSGDPSTSNADAVRFLLHDTQTPWIFSDGEIAWEISESGSVWTAAANLAMDQTARYADKRDKTVGPLSIRYGDVSDRWTALAKGLRTRAGTASGALAIMTQTRRYPHVRLGFMDIRPETDPWFIDPRDMTNVGEYEFPDVLDGGGP